MNPTSDTKPKRTALISVYEKTPQLLTFAQGLIALGFGIISSGGTADYLSKNDIPTTSVSDYTGCKPVLDHRVVTLNEKLHGGLIAATEQLDELEGLGWTKIDLAYYSFYPLAGALEATDATLESCIKQTDIGGPAALRSAAKSRRTITPYNDKQLAGVLKWLQAGEPDRQKFVDALAGRAERYVAEYIELSARVRERFCEFSVLNKWDIAA